MERQESHSLFRGMKNGTATLKDSLAESSVSHKTKYSPTKQFSNLTYKHFPNWFDSVVTFQLLRWVWHFATPWTAACQASLSFNISQSLNSCPLSQRCHPTISSSVTLFSSCPQSFPVSGSLPMSRFMSMQQVHMKVYSIFIHNQKELEATKPSISIDKQTGIYQMEHYSIKKRTIRSLISHTSKVMLKILQARL